MNIKEFAEKYYLHDSSIEKIEYNYENQELKLKIEFCFWQQIDYNKNEPSNGLILVTFQSVSNFEYDENISDKIFADEHDNEILDAKVLKNDTLILNIRETTNYNPLEEIFYQLKITAKNVEVDELERYDL